MFRFTTTSLISIGVVALFTLLLLASPDRASAACEAKDDPCAPKKELDSWKKSVALGFNYTSGNSDTTVLSLLGQVSRETSADLIDINAAYGYGEDRAREASGEDAKNKDDLRSTASYKYLLSERSYLGVGANFLYDDIADVDYRVNIGPTVGYFLLKNADVKFELNIGPGYTFERVGGVSNDYFSPKVGERFDWIISCTSKLYQLTDFYYDTSDSENYQIVAEGGIEAALLSNLSLVFLIRDTLDNVPAADREKNDLSMITALKISL